VSTPPATGVTGAGVTGAAEGAAEGAADAAGACAMGAAVVGFTERRTRSVRSRAPAPKATMMAVDSLNFGSVKNRRGER
jgi:hypothetical protein